MSEEIVGNTMPSLCTRLPRRIKLSELQLEKITLEDLIHSWHDQDLYIDALESQASSLEADMASLRESEERMRQQHLESTHREKVLVRRLASKEQEMQEYASQISEFKAGQTAGSSALRSALLDPAVNLLLQRLRGELLATRSRLEETQNELSAWKFTPDSNTGKRLMAKCRLLYQENEELGRMISSGRLAKLEGELALQKSFSDEVKKSQSELDEFLQDLDEDVEGMQSTIYYLQQELRKSKEANLALQQQKNNVPTLEIINNSLNEKTSAQNPILKEQSTSTMEEVKLEPGLLPSKSPSSLSEPSSPHQVESSEKTDDALESAERQSEKVPEEGVIPNELVRVKEISEENPSQSVVAIVSQETLGNEKENIKDMKVNFELSCYSESDTIDETEKLREMDNKGKDGIKVEVDDQDSQGELMIEVGSEQGDSEGDVVDEEKCMEINKKADLSGINGLFKLSESGKNTKEEVDSDEERKKRPFPETNLSDEDSDDTPLIKKVRRNHDQAAKNKL